MLGYGVDAQHATHRGRPLLHALQPEAPGGAFTLGVEPAAVVLDHEPEALGTLEADPDVLRGTVARRVGDGFAHNAQQVLGDLTGHLDVVGQLEVPGHAEAGPEVLHGLGDGGIERLRLRDGEHGDGAPGLVQGPVGRTGQGAGVVRRRGACRGAAGLAGDEGQLVGQAVVQLAGDPPALLHRGLLLQPAVGGPIGERQFEEVAEGDAALDALHRDGATAGGDGEDTVQLPVGTDGDPGAVGDSRGVDDRLEQRARVRGVERRGDRLARLDGLPQSRMFRHRPRPHDIRPRTVELRAHDHHAVLNREVRRPEDLRPARRHDAHGELRRREP